MSSAKQLIVAPSALDDLANIYRYIAEHDGPAARAFLADLNAKIAWIATSGFTGVPRDWIRPGLRALPYRERSIYFRVTVDTVVILRVLHQRQDIEHQSFD